MIITPNLMSDMAIAVELSRSSWGDLEPQITIRSERPQDGRRLNATAFLLGAAIELKSGQDEQWLVRTEVKGGRLGRVYIELASRYPEELERAVKVLRQVADDFR